MTLLPPTPPSDATHHEWTLWAAECAERVLPFFTAQHPTDARPRNAIEAARAWVRGELPMIKAREAAFAAHAAARSVNNSAAREAARAAGHAAASAHVSTHAPHAASYARKAIAHRNAAPILHPALVVVYGDSITEALDLAQGERGNRWTDVVARESNGLLQIINEGKGGRPTDALHEFEAVLARNRQADVFVIALGANDARDISDACVPKAITNLRTMITRVREVDAAAEVRASAGVRVLIVAPTNIRKDCLGPTRPIANERDGKLRELGAAFLALANETGCAFVNTYDVIAPESLTVDGVHPDRAGHAAIAAVMLPKLLEVSARAAR